MTCRIPFIFNHFSYTNIQSFFKMPKVLASLEIKDLCQCQTWKFVSRLSYLLWICTFTISTMTKIFINNSNPLYIIGLFNNRDVTIHIKYFIDKFVDSFNSEISSSSANFNIYLHIDFVTIVFKFVIFGISLITFQFFKTLNFHYSKGTYMCFESSVIERIEGRILNYSKIPLFCTLSKQN